MGEGDLVIEEQDKPLKTLINDHKHNQEAEERKKQKSQIRYHDIELLVKSNNDDESTTRNRSRLDIGTKTMQTARELSSMLDDFKIQPMKKLLEL